MLTTLLFGNKSTDHKYLKIFLHPNTCKTTAIADDELIFLQLLAKECGECKNSRMATSRNRKYYTRRFFLATNLSDEIDRLRIYIPLA